MNVNARILEIIKKYGFDYLDVAVYKDYNQLYRISTPNATGNERLQMYSMSKIFTVVCIMQMIERGILKLDDKVEKFFPCFKKTFYKKDGKVLENPTSITIKHLLTMTSGLNYNTDTESIKRVQREKGDNALLKDFIPAFLSEPLAFETGKSYEYGLSHDVLAGVVEIVSGMNFADYVEKNIFLPLGMKNASFRNVTDGVYLKNICNEDLTISVGTTENELLLSKKYISGGAGLVCSIDEYLKMVLALTNNGVAENGYVLLKKETIDLMIKNPLTNDFVKHSFSWLGEDYGYGLGVRVREKTTEWGLEKGEFGWDGACGSFWLSDRKNKISIVIGMNVFAWDRKYLGVHMEIVKEIYKTLKNKKNKINN